MNPTLLEGLKLFVLLTLLVIIWQAFLQVAPMIPRFQ